MHIAYKNNQNSSEEFKSDPLSVITEMALPVKKNENLGFEIIKSV